MRLFRLFRVLLATMLATASMAFATGTVFASQPTVTTTVFTGSDSYDCGEFDALVEFTQSLRQTTFFDADGAPVRIQNMSRFEATVTNSVTGLTIPATASYTVVFDLVTGDEAYDGQVYRVTRVGAGIVVLDAGRLLFGADGSVSIAGPHQVFEAGEMALFCQALA